MTPAPTFSLESIKEILKELDGPWHADGPQVRFSTTVGSFWLATCSTETVARAIASLPAMMREIERLNQEVRRLQNTEVNDCDLLGVHEREIERLKADRIRAETGAMNIAGGLANAADEADRLRSLAAELVEALENFVGYGCDWSDLDETECRDLMNSARAALAKAKGETSPEREGS